MKKGKGITEKDVEDGIMVLFKTNSTLKLLKQEIRDNIILFDLIKSVLGGKKIKYDQYKEFSIEGTGAIVEYDNNCAIRNEIYGRFLEKII